MDFSEEYYRGVKRWQDIGKLSSLELVKSMSNQSEPSIFPFLSAFKDLKILDFGCGIGRNFNALKPYSKEIHGYDLSNVLSRCDKPYDKLISNLDDLEDYDLILDSFTLQFITCPDAVIQLLDLFFKKTKYLYIKSRLYLDDSSNTNLLSIIKDTKFSEVRSSLDVEKWSKSQPIEKGFDLLLEKPIVKINNTTRHNCDVAFISNQYNYYRGGRYHDFLVATMLQELGLNVKLFTGTVPNYGNDFLLYNTPEIVECNINKLDIKASMYFGTPLEGCLRAIENASKYNKSCYLLVYDCPTWIKKIFPKENRETDKYNKIKDSIKKYNPDFKILTLSQNSINDWADFLDIPKNKIDYLNPCVNSRTADCVKSFPKENWIVSINHNEDRKNWEETFEIFKSVSGYFKLQAITSPIVNIYDKMASVELNPNTVHLHDSISDLEKFNIIKKSKCLISNSIFEGFGMWCIEALYCNIPVVCYNLTSLKNIHHPLLFKVNSKEEFKSKVNELCFT